MPAPTKLPSEATTPAGKRDFDQEAQAWDENPFRRQVGQTLGRIISTALPLSESDTVLDYGTGTGLVALALCNRVRQVVAADSSRGMLEVLATKTKAAGIANIQPLFLDLEALSGPLPTVDAVVCSLTLHHLRDIGQVTAAFHSMLRPGGQIAIADLVTEAGDFHADNRGVQHFGFDPGWLRDTFVAAGFADVQTRIVHTIERQVASGEIKGFPVLLLTAAKR